LRQKIIFIGFLWGIIFSYGSTSTALKECEESSKAEDAVVLRLPVAFFPGHSLEKEELLLSENMSEISGEKPQTGSKDQGAPKKAGAEEEFCSPEVLYRKGCKCSWRSDHKDAFGWYLQAAKRGHTRAQFEVGLHYKKGLGIRRENYEEAHKWLIRAANKGHADAQFHIAQIYEEGLGVVQNSEVALVWWIKAGKQGHLDAQFNAGAAYDKKGKYEPALEWWMQAAWQGDKVALYNVGHFLYTGEGIDKNPRKAYEWWLLSAEQFYGPALVMLGFLHYEGEGVVEQDPREAFKWWILAAEREYPEAQFLIGCLYHEGEGVTQNLEEATIWLRTAAEWGNREAEKRLKDIEFKRH